MLDLPPFSLEHVRLLTDGRGIIQHALFSIPNRKSGYTTDDNSRALVVVTRRYGLTRDPELVQLAALYLSFMLYTQRADGRFRNYVGYDSRYLDEEGSEDCQGRAAWALGLAASSALPESMRRSARHMFDKAAPNCYHLHSPRALAGVIRGIYQLTGGRATGDLREKVALAAQRLSAGYQAEAGRGWQWFEGSLTYANASLPEAMFLAYLMLGDERLRVAAEKTFGFLLSVVMPEGTLLPVGTDGWYRKGGERAAFDQQPEEAEAIVSCSRAGWVATGRADYRKLAGQALGWFLGENVHAVELYDPLTGACFDGLTPEGPNQNQGAESTLAYLSAHLTLEEWDPQPAVGERDETGLQRPPGAG